MKPKIITMAMCIAFAIPITSNAEISGVVQEQYSSDGARHVFISDLDHIHEGGWEYICENGFHDMERNFRYVEIVFDEDTEDERDDYSYVQNCEVIARVCGNGQYIIEKRRDDGTFVEYACAPCPTAPDGTQGRSWCDSWYDYNGGIDCSISGIASCFVTGGKDTTGTYKYTSNCYYKQ